MIRHANRPNAYRAPRHAFRHRCSCKPNKTGGDHRFTPKERQARRIA